MSHQAPPAPDPEAAAIATVKLRLEFGGLRLGPGKAALLEGIAALGSISAAGAGMGMSYRRAWTLVEEMNRAFAAPLVESVRGGRGGGGAALTDTGRAVLDLYRALERRVSAGGAAEIAALAALLATPGALPGGGDRVMSDQT